MIPVKLALRNFMCYRDNVPPLHFDSFRVACLAGDNGHGKSALLDAITWALWGKSRAKSDDELIHLGRTEMEVEFEFRLGEHHYRVVRKRSKPKSERSAGQTVLELTLQVDGQYRPITANSVRETEKKIVDILRMEYDTFINSVFLLQGRADEFTTKTPSERKQVLADILGLGYYDELERRARDRSRAIGEESRELQAELAAIERELANKDVYVAELAQIEEQVGEIEREAGRQEAALAALRSRRALFELKRKLLAEAEQRIANAARELAVLAPRLEEQRRRLAEQEALLAEAPAIRAGHQALAALRLRHDELAQQQVRQAGLQEQRHRLLLTIEKAKQTLAHRLEVVDNESKAAQQLVAARPKLVAELDQAKAELDACAKLEVRNAEARTEVHQLAAQVEVLKKENGQLKTEMQELKEKVILIQKGDVTCPLCETELGHDGCQRLAAKFQAEGKAKAERYRQNDQEIRRLVERHEQLHRELVVEEERLGRNRRTAQRRAAVLEKDIEQADQAELRLGQLVADRERLHGELAAGSFAAAEQRALAEIDQTLAAIAFDPAEFERVRRAVAEHAGFEERYRRLASAEESAPAAQSHLASLEEQAARARETRDEQEERRRGLQAELADFGQLLDDLTAAERAYERIVRDLNQTRLREGALRQLLDTCAKQEIRRAELAGEIKRKAEERAIYEELAVAFSKKGVQAMIIEGALPEIETGANEILGRMTDNRMHVAIETQRDTRKGDTVETLDIKIADELGTRDYALFSGGEAYRVNFALRVALAKLLARRAGAQLQTLVVDEGFGTQDTSGREKLVEAITSIQADFERILVVTHIDELKDLFPNRIEVLKTAEGSTVQVV